MPRLGRVSELEGGTRPWIDARGAAVRAGVRLVTLEALRDVGRINQVIDRIWGDQYLHPDLLRALQHAGCSLIGAESPEGALVGYAFAFPGTDRGVHLHSHMAAVLPEWQARGVGYALKLAQRAEGLERGIAEIRWTYDPLLARNAWFNLVKLGGVAVRLLPDFYGDMKDLQNAGDRSDRFEVRWSLASRRVEGALGGAGPRPGPEGAAWRLRSAPPSALGGWPRPAEDGGAGPPEGTRAALVAVPSDYQALRAADRGLAVAWRDAARRAFAACFAAGLVATSIDRASVYLFEPATSVAEEAPEGGGPADEAEVRL